MTESLKNPQRNETKESPNPDVTLSDMPSQTNPLDICRHITEQNDGSSLQCRSGVCAVHWKPVRCAA